MPILPRNNGLAIALVVLMVFGLARSSWAQEADGETEGGADVPSLAYPGLPMEVEPGFRFGSYGRVVVATDLEGGSGKPVLVASYAPRLIEDPYLELDFSYIHALVGADFRTVVTLAISDALLHFDGDFDGVFALRNAFVEATLGSFRRLSLWAGSRMLRGDDIYLLDFWPLDNLNTIGGGGLYRFGSGYSQLGFHVGINQLQDTFQYQEVTVAGPSFETEQQIFQDRVRVLASLRFEQAFRSIVRDWSLKYVVYADYQGLGEGQFENEDDTVIALPSDLGFTLGAELGVWEEQTANFFNLFLRYSQGLAAYGELAIPFGLADDRTATDASLVRLGASANWEYESFGVTAGAYIQWFHDADDTTFDPDDYWETVLSVRPVVFLSEHVHQAVEFSYQRRRPDGLSARSDTFLEPAVWQIGVLPIVATGPSAFARPQLRVIYALSFLNDGALDLFPDGDARGTRDVQHYLGIGAEWWFNSSTYQ